ncbi:hypothetical protein NQZ68_031891 [Dissostichus eleginoides]|nr:hypothetical protein NQZ68_031891 [Dissostichus eleginoides]
MVAGVVLICSLQVSANNEESKLESRSLSGSLSSAASARQPQLGSLSSNPHPALGHQAKIHILGLLSVQGYATETEREELCNVITNSII